MYQHTQPGTLVLSLIGFAAALLTGVMVNVGFENSVATWIIGVVMVLMAVIAFLFWSLTVEVEKDELIVFFGSGLIRVKYLISDITAVDEVRNHWYYGWGIRYTPHGWLYNVSGFDAVQIKLRNGRQYRIGTDQPNELATVLKLAIGSPSNK